MERKHLLIIVGAVCILAAVALILVFTGGTILTAGTSVYQNGVLTTPIHYEGEEKDVWFQYNIFRQDTLLRVHTGVRIRIGPWDADKRATSPPNWRSISPRGEYKVFIYVLERAGRNPQNYWIYSEYSDPMMQIFDNALLFNPAVSEWQEASFSVEDGMVTIVGKPGSLTGDKVYDLRGARVVPGLIDAHVHIESSLLTPREFGRTVSCQRRDYG